MLTDNPQQEEPGYGPTRGHGETLKDDHKWVKGAGRQLSMPTEEKQIKEVLGKQKRWR